MNCLLTLNLAFLLCFMNGLLRHSLSQLRGWQVDWRTEGRLPLCQWLDSFLGSWSFAIKYNVTLVMPL